MGKKRLFISWCVVLFLASLCYGEAGDLELPAGLNVATDVNALGTIKALTRLASNIWLGAGGQAEWGSAIGLTQLELEALSGTNTDIRLLLRPKGTGVAIIAATNTLNIVDVNFVTSEGKISALESASEGKTEALELFGFRAGDQLRSMTVGIGKDEDNSVSFAGLGKYLFDNAVEISGTLDITGVTTVTADINLSNNALINIGYIDFETGAVAPAHSEGRIFYDDDEKTLAVYNNESEVTLQLGQEMFIRATNKTGSTITNGQLVYINGAQGSRPTIALAKADSVNTCQVIAMATHDIEDNTTGFVTNNGLVHDVNTAGINAGDAIYLSAATAGIYTDTAPTAPNFIIQVGRVIFENDTSGIIYIDIGPTAVCGTMVIQDLDINADLDVVGDITADDITTTSLTLNLANDYLLTERTGGQSLAIQNQQTNISSRLELFTKDGDGLDSLDFSIYAKGLPSDITNRELASLSYLTLPEGGPLFALRTSASGTGTVLPWSIYTGANTTQLVLNIDNSIDMSGALSVTGTVSGATGSTFGNLTLADGSITDSSNAIDFGNEALSTSGNVTLEDVIHTGDADTKINFGADSIQFEVGGIPFLTFIESPAPLDASVFNIGGGDIDFIVESVGQAHALFVQGSDGSVGIRASTPDTTLQVIGTAGFGDDAGNEALFAADGLRTMHGTARVIKHIQGIEELGKGGSAPTVRTTEEPYVSYTYAVGNDSHITFEIPEEMDFTEAADIKVHWYTSVTQTNDEVNWEAKWNGRAVGETVNVGQTIDTTGDINCSAQWIIVESTVETIPGNSLAAGDIFGLHLERIAIIDGTNPQANTIHVLSIELHYVSDKDGEAT